MSVVSCFYNLVMSLSDTFVFKRRHGEGKPQLILPLPFCNITWSEWNLINLAASPLDLLRSTRYLWSLTIEMDNDRGATINCLPCAALTCLHLLGFQCCLGTRQQCVCTEVCLFVCCCKGRVLGWLCNLARHQLELAKKEKESEGSKCRLSIFPLLCFTSLPKQEDVNNADNCLVDRFTRENYKRRELALHLIMQYNSPVTFTILYSGVQDVMKCCVCKEDTVALAYCFSS